MAEIVMSVVLFLIAGVNFFVSYRSFREQGFLINNSYIYATKQEREFMNKKPYYRQTAISFLLLGIFFLIDGVALLSGIDVFFVIAGLDLVALIIFAIVSSTKIEKKH